MTPQQIELIKATVPVLRESGVALTTYFYQRVLKNHPELKSTFNLDNQSTGMQPRALAGAVLAYAENIENPSVLAKAVERITTKHVSLNIQAEHYGIVGDNLLNSISEVLNVPMDSELIAAWKVAYLQLADLLIGVEKQKYTELQEKVGGWTGWRKFKVSAIESIKNGKRFTIQSEDQAAVVAPEAGQYISLKVTVPNQSFEQPQQFVLVSSTDNSYSFDVNPENTSSEFSVANILLNNYAQGDAVQVSAPLNS